MRAVGFDSGIPVYIAPGFAQTLNDAVNPGLLGLNYHIAEAWAGGYHNLRCTDASACVSIVAADRR